MPLPEIDDAALAEASRIFRIGHGPEEQRMIAFLENYFAFALANGNEIALPPLDEKGFEPLARVLRFAYEQSARGKGRKRHGHGRPFLEQPIMTIARMTGVGGHTYQICKKAQEAGTMALRGDIDAAQAEFLGVIIYAAAAYLLIDKNTSDDKESE